jgi:hypothetical protein
LTDPNPRPRRTVDRAATFLTLLLGCSPVAVLYAAYLGGADSARLWLTTIGLYTLALSAGYWPGAAFGNARLRAGLLGLLGLAGAFTLTQAWTLFRAWWGAVYAVPLIALWLFALRASAKPPGQEASPAVWTTMAGAHAFIALTARISNAETETVSTAHAALNVVAPIYFLLIALRLNDCTLTIGAAPRKTGKTSGFIQRKNTLLVLGAAALTLAAANIGLIGAAAQRALVYTITGILWLLSKVTFVQSAEPGGGGGEGMDLSGLGEAAEPSRLAIILERVFMVIAIIIAIAAAGVALYVIGRKLVVLMRRIAARFARLASELNQGYADESERVFDWDEFMRGARERVRKLIPRRERLPKWSELDNRARVRLAIRALMIRKPDMPESLTIRQALTRGELKAAPADAAALAMSYDAARYSAGEVSDEEAENARAAFERVKTH